jgi:hypothetical protein
LTALATLRLWHYRYGDGGSDDASRWPSRHLAEWLPTLPAMTRFEIDAPYPQAAPTQGATHLIADDNPEWHFVKWFDPARVPLLATIAIGCDAFGFRPSDLPHLTDLHLVHLRAESDNDDDKDDAARLIAELAAHPRLRRLAVDDEDLRYTNALDSVRARGVRIVYPEDVL